jgi:hypothetical protein
MGGAVKKGVSKLVSSGGVREAVQPPPETPKQTASDDSDLIRRRARRGARALLSEARLNPELGVGGQTLGSGPMA